MSWRSAAPFCFFALELQATDGGCGSCGGGWRAHRCRRWWARGWTSTHPARSAGCARVSRNGQKISNHTTTHRTAPHRTAPHHTTPHHTAPCETIPHYPRLSQTTPGRIRSYQATPHYARPTRCFTRAPGPTRDLLPHCLPPESAAAAVVRQPGRHHPRQRTRRVTPFRAGPCCPPQTPDCVDTSGPQQRKTHFAPAPWHRAVAKGVCLVPLVVVAQAFAGPARMTACGGGPRAPE